MDTYESLLKELCSYNLAMINLVEGKRAYKSLWETLSNKITEIHGRMNAMEQTIEDQRKARQMKADKNWEWLTNHTREFLDGAEPPK